MLKQPRGVDLVLLFLALAATLAAASYGTSFPPDALWLLPALAVVWGVSLAALLPAVRRIVGAPLRALRALPVLYWVALLVYLWVAPGVWVVNDQPAFGRWLAARELAALWLMLWGLWFLLTYDADAVQARAMGAKLARSRFSGALVMLTTIVLILMAAEAGMRLFYVTTDGFGFTAMNYHWYKNFYWGHANTYGYRDDEPDPAAAHRVVVVGDSFAVGHGISNLDDTFPHVLEALLGAGYDVTLVGQSGWDTDQQVAALENFPLPYDAVVWSYYLNDMNFLVRDTPQNPDLNFSFPQDPALNWIVLNFFVPNYIYYNLLQFNAQARTSGHASDLVALHLDDALWAQQAWWLDRVVTDVQGRGARLVVLLWPQLAAIEASAPAVARVRGFFTARGVTVVDMSDPLRGRAVNSIILNRFDTHPNAAANRLAADALYQVLATP